MSKIVDHVIDKRGYALMGDSRGVIVSCTLRNQIWQWAEENKIKIEYQGTLDGMDLWYVKEDKHRSWFVLRWS